MKNELLTKATRILSSAKFQIKKHSPELLLAAGITGTIAGTILACKATLKSQEIIKTRNENLEKMDELYNENITDYTEEDYRNDLKILNIQTTINIAKTFAPSIGIMGLSLFSIIAGHRILKKRNMAIAAAYAIVDTSFKKYRKNVIEKFGEEIDKELRYSVKKKEIEVTDKKGNIKNKVVETIDIDDVSKYSEYAKVFDAACREFEKDPEYNLMFLRRQQDYANEKLKAQGYLFLNDVYELLDIPKTKAGQVVGWTYVKNGNNPNGDNYVDFGIYDISDEAKRSFINGTEYNIILDFNVDGLIYDKIF